MRIFVTGGTGLVGSHTIERLARAGHDVVAMARSDRGWPLLRSLGARPVPGHVERAEDWAPAEGADAIVHAAAIVTDPVGWDSFSRINVDGTYAAAQAAASSGARLVHVSSVAVYGRRPRAAEGSRVSEDTPFGPIADADFYARSKRDAEAVLWAEAARRRVSAVALRPCVIYGERERLFIARMLRLLRHGVAPLVGRGDNILAMVYVGSVIDAITCALERPDVTGPFNVTNDGGFTQREFFEIVGEASGRRVRLLPVPEPLAAAVGTGWHAVTRTLHPRRYAGLGSSGGRFLARDNPFESGRARRELDWQPRTDAKEALRRTIRWFLERQGPIGR